MLLKDRTAIAAVASSQQVQVVLDALGAQGQVGRLVIARHGVQHPGHINNDSQLSSPTGPAAVAGKAIVEEAETVVIDEA